MDNIPEVVRNTAKNMYELLMQLASHIEKLEAENKTLKEENERNNRGS
jgi:uncharacterized protein (UPF0335 family)